MFMAQDVENPLCFFFFFEIQIRAWVTNIRARKQPEKGMSSARIIIISSDDRSLAS